MLKRLLHPRPLATNAALLVLRMFILFLLYYGFDKVVHFGDKASYWPDPFSIGSEATLMLTIMAELVCPVFIAFGMFTRLALIPAIINMLFAVLIGHEGQPFIEREHAFSFLIPLIVIFLAGPGKFSVDAILYKSS